MAIFGSAEFLRAALAGPVPWVPLWGRKFSEKVFVPAKFSQHLESPQRGPLGAIEALEENFGTVAEFGVPPGGIYLWIKLPPEVDTLKLADAALKQGVAFNPGPQWSVDPDAAKNYLRICFANPSEQELRDGVAKLAQVCFEETSIPPRSANVSR